MPGHKFKMPYGKYYSSDRLHNVSRKIVQLAFQMGGSPAKYFKARKCDYVFPDGTPCYDEQRGDANVDCPLCRGNGAYYEEPVDVPIMIMDSTNPLSQDKYGFNIYDTIQISVPIWINPTAIKVSNTGKMFTAKDKFAVYDHSSNLWSIFIVNTETNEPYINGPLYHILGVVSQYTETQDIGILEREPKFYFKFTEKELLGEINKQILYENSLATEEYPEITNEDIVVGDGVTYQLGPDNLVDDWET